MDKFKTELEVGDVVVLNSNPNKPHMTVQAIYDGELYKEVECVWFDVNNELRAGDFNSECLVKIS